MTTILRCTCEHNVQDILYGMGMRVHTRVRKPLGGSGDYECVTCGSKKQIKSAPEPKPAGKKRGRCGES